MEFLRDVSPDNTFFYDTFRKGFGRVGFGLDSGWKFWETDRYDLGGFKELWVSSSR